MKKNHLPLIVALIGSVVLTNCKKTTEIIEVRVQSIDSLATTSKYLVGKWNNSVEEREEYSAGIMVQKKITNYTGTNTNITYKTDGTYASNYMGAAAGGGSWQLLTPRVFVQDKGVTDERYFQIVLLDSLNLVTKGPFKSNGEIKGNFLYTFHYKK